MEIIAPTGAESAVNPLGNCGKTNQSAVIPTGSPRNNRAEISFAIFMLLMKRLWREAQLSMENKPFTSVAVVITGVACIA